MKKRFATLAVAALIVFTFLFAQGPVQKVRLWDTNNSHSLLLKWNEDRAATYTMNWIGITADRTITLQGNPTLDDWFDQNYHMIATPTFAGLYLESSTAAPFLKMTNESDAERDPIIQFSVGATPAIKFTFGVDDSDVDKWKLAVGDEFGDAHDTIVVSSGEGSTPPVAEFTLIDTWQTPISGAPEDPSGACTDGTYVYYTVLNPGSIVKIDPVAGTEITRNTPANHLFGQIVCDGTYLYAIQVWGGSRYIEKYKCSDLSYVDATDLISQTVASLFYWSGHLYCTDQSNGIRKVRCSDMSLIWRVSYPAGDPNFCWPDGIVTDGAYLYVLDDMSNGIIRLNMDGTWVDIVAVANPMQNDSLWISGQYLYAGVDTSRVDQLLKSDRSLVATFTVGASAIAQAFQYNGHHYLVSDDDTCIYKYTSTSTEAAGASYLQIRLREVYGQTIDIARFTGDVRFGVGTTIPSEKIEAVGNIKATAGQFISTMATGTAPVVVSSTTVCPNLNAGLWDGYHLPALAVGDMLYGDGTTTVAKLADVAAGSYLRSGGVVTAPLWSTLILPNAATAYRLPVATSANTIGELAAAGATGEYLKGNTGAIPSWATLNQAAVVGLTTADGPSFAHLHLADVAAITTAAESWVGPSSTAGIYFKGGLIGIGTTSPGYPLDVNGGGLCAARFISPHPQIVMATNLTDHAVKEASFAMPHYHIEEEYFNFFYPFVTSTENGIYFGGGSSAYNGATLIAFCTNPNTTTLSAIVRMAIDGNGNVIIGSTTPISGYELTVYNDIYAVGNMSALTFTDRTPYPKDKKEAYDAVLSLEGKDGMLNHSKLHPYVKAEDGRNLSALVSAQNEVIRDLMIRIEALEKK